MTIDYFGYVSLPPAIAEQVCRYEREFQPQPSRSEPHMTVLVPGRILAHADRPEARTEEILRQNWALVAQEFPEGFPIRLSRVIKLQTGTAWAVAWLIEKDRCLSRLIRKLLEASFLLLGQYGPHNHIPLPHITLASKLTRERSDELFRKARNEFPAPAKREFIWEKLKLARRTNPLQPWDIIQTT